MNNAEVTFYKIAKEFLEDDLNLDAYVRELDPNPGTLRDDIVKELTRCDYHISLLTETSLQRQWVVFELGAAMSGLGRCIEGFVPESTSRRIIPIVECHKVLEEAECSLLEGLKLFFWNEDSGSPSRPVHRGEQRIWNTAFHTNHVQEEIGLLLLEHTFEGLNSHVLRHRYGDPKGVFSREEYENWLTSFRKWSQSELCAMSREPLSYWLTDGAKYRLALKERIAKHSLSKRLSIWSNENDLIPAEWHNDIEMKKRLWEAVGRSGSPQYGCPLCITCDLLQIFLRDCHNPQDEAYYAFEKAIGFLAWTKELSELLIYEDRYVMETKFADMGGADVEYHLSHHQFGSHAGQLKELVKWIKTDNLDSSIVDTSSGWQFPAWGQLSNLILSLMSYHKDHSCGWDITIISDVECCSSSMNR